NILKKYVLSLTKDIEEDALSIHIDTVINELKDSINDINSQLNKEVEIRFNSQKNNRPEFSELNFVDVIRSWCEDEVFKPELVMSKPIIKMFVTELENKIGVSLFLRSSNEDDEVASTLLLKYFDFIKVIDDLYPSFRNLMEQLEVLERV
ncbi:hypothetical protein VZF51_20405, partial [Serratia marcescens]|nr:hypothetical protein [Serratia marcescens]